MLMTLFYTMFYASLRPHYYKNKYYTELFNEIMTLFLFYHV